MSLAFLNGTKTLLDFLIVVFSVLNEFNLFSIGAYCFFAAQNTSYLRLHEFLLKIMKNQLACVFGRKQSVFAD